MYAINYPMSKRSFIDFTNLAPEGEHTLLRHTNKHVVIVKKLMLFHTTSNPPPFILLLLVVTQASKLMMSSFLKFVCSSK